MPGFQIERLLKATGLGHCESTGLRLMRRSLALTRGAVAPHIALHPRRIAPFPPAVALYRFSCTGACACLGACADKDEGTILRLCVQFWALALWSAYSLSRWGTVCVHSGVFPLPCLFLSAPLFFNSSFSSFSSVGFRGWRACRS